MRIRKNIYKNYKSIEFLPFWNYYKVSENNDHRYLLKLDDYEELPEIEIDLSDIWENICFEIADINKDTDIKSKLLFDTRKNISVLELRYYHIKTILSALSHGYDEELIEELKNNGFRIDKNKDFQNEWIRINKQSENLKTKLEIKKKDYVDMLPKSDNSTHIESIIQSIERYYNYSTGTINPHKITTKNWFIMLNKVIQESHKRSMKNG